MIITINYIQASNCIQIVGWLVGEWVVFYGISILVGYLMLKPVYRYIKHMRFVNKFFVGNILNQP